MKRGIAISIQADAAARVALRNLHLTGTSGGTYSVGFNQGAELYIDNVVATGFSVSGIHVGAPNSQSSITDAVVRRNGPGIVVHPATGTAYASIVRSRAENNMSNTASMLPKGAPS